MAESFAYNRDCMEAMREFPDKFFDLAVVDPPYGDGSSQSLNVERERERERETDGRPAWNRFGQRFDRYKHPEAELCKSGGGVARQAEIPPRYTRSGTGGSGVARAGGGWANRLDPSKKSLRGM